MGDHPSGHLALPDPRASFNEADLSGATHDNTIVCPDDRVGFAASFSEFV